MYSCICFTLFFEREEVYRVFSIARSQRWASRHMPSPMFVYPATVGICTSIVAAQHNAANMALRTSCRSVLFCCFILEISSQTKNDFQTTKFVIRPSRTPYEFPEPWPAQCREQPTGRCRRQPVPDYWGWMQRRQDPYRESAPYSRNTRRP